jgi:hypothetical protein
VYVCALSGFPHESLGISNTHSNLGFGILLLLRLILLVFYADFVGYGIDRKSTSGICHFLGSSLVCWSAHKQSYVAQSTTEAEYVAAASYYSQIIWIVQTMRDYGVTYKSILLMCDSSSAICLAQNPVFHGRAKHIKVIYHFLIDHVEKGDIVMKYINT